MDEKLLLEESLQFLGLTYPYQQSELKEAFHKLAKKYHPDSGEFTSDVMFLELKRHYENLQNLLEKKDQNPNQETKNEVKISSATDMIFALYKKAKMRETKAILKYYESRDSYPLQLSSVENPQLDRLRKDLAPVLAAYNKILKEAKESLWARDAKESLERLRVWWDQSQL